GGEYAIKHFTFGLDAKYQGEAYLDIANTETIDGFALLNLRTTYQADDNISFSIFLNNVTDQMYNASGYTVDYGDGGATADEVRYFRQAGFNMFASIVVRI
ncbi:MAG: TonB-dependent receptor, partial [bacterium]|nr:TonB-dependent receptor [bacterium]